MCVVFILIFGQVIAFRAHFFVVHFEHMGRQSFGTGRLVIAQHANIRFRVRIQMPLQAPIVAARPSAIAAHEAFVAFFLRRGFLTAFFHF